MPEDGTHSLDSDQVCGAVKRRVLPSCCRGGGEATPAPSSGPCLCPQLRDHVLPFPLHHPACLKGHFYPSRAGKAAGASTSLHPLLQPFCPPPFALRLAMLPSAGLLLPPLPLSRVLLSAGVCALLLASGETLGGEAHSLPSPTGLGVSMQAPHLSPAEP